VPARDKRVSAGGKGRAIIPRTGRRRGGFTQPRKEKVRRKEKHAPPGVGFSPKCDHTAVFGKRGGGPRLRGKCDRGGGEGKARKWV